jgi:hypothetical protein
MSRWINYAGDIWGLTFAASFTLSIVVGIIQDRRRKEFWDTPLFPFMVYLHYAWVIPALLVIAASGVIVFWPILLALGIVAGAFWLLLTLLSFMQRRRPE